jgi:hypothetical protein
MSKQQPSHKPSAQTRSNQAASAKDKSKLANADDLDYLSTWDALSYDPDDVFMHEPELTFEDGSFDVGEEYPRGV